MSQPLPRTARWLLALGLWLRLALPAAAGDETPAADPLPAEGLRFAEALYAEGDHYRAITEYKRYLFHRPDGPRSGWVRLRIGQSYLAGRRWTAARLQFERLWRQQPPGRLRALAGFSLARGFYLDGRLEQALAVLERLLERPLDAELRSAGWYLAACAELRSGRLRRARRALDGVSANGPLADRAWRLAGGLQRARRLEYKSPLAAGLLSVVPGLGHLYLEQPAVGLTALAWNGMFGYAVFESFRHRRWGLGVLLAAVELLWYSGTIYGAVAGAHRSNRDARHAHLDRLDAKAGLDVAYPPDDAIHGLLLQGRF